ncbi:uncharacterized protein LOC119735148 [Patiria miniata]|uniref:Uncharacterized protein n=1 Tax=Patiria miniata TaxID=46514 RepID=A0A914AMF7_PATMI|nr:uncharacterized protein LOC119735148 [Patiria miniata]
MSAADKEKTAFSSHCGLYQFRVMPFGLCNAPSTFERLMERVLHGLQWQICLVYLDDVIIFSKTFESHIDRLGVVLDRIRQAGLKLKPDKCHLLQEEVSYLGHIVSKGGVKTDPSKTRQIEEWPVPRNIQEVRSFLGLASYYRRFVASFAEIARPLHKLTEKDKDFRWTHDCQLAFEQLKQRLTSALVLAYPKLDPEFILDTDASNSGIGAVLSQLQDGQERVIAYASRALSKPERNYCVTRKELLAVVHFIKHFRPYLYGCRFLLRTDHGSLRWLFNFKEPEGQVARWLQVLAEYDFNIEHRPGRKHSNADAMSRRPCTCTRCKGIQVEQGYDSGEQPSHEGRTQVKGDQHHSTKEKCQQIEGLWKFQEQDPDLPTEPVHSLLAQHHTHSSDSSQFIREVSSFCWLKGFTASELREKQTGDPTLQKIIGWLESGNPRPTWREVSAEGTWLKTLWGAWQQLCLHDRVLYRRWDEDDRHHSRWLLVVPRSLRAEVFKQLHNDHTAGHLGINKMHAKVKSRFFVEDLRDSVVTWCTQCLQCAKRKPPPNRGRAPIRQQVSGVPMERVAIDITGPFPITETRKNRYILVITDYFSKWTEAFPLQDVTAQTVANVFVREFVSRFGVPRQLHSDQGRQFESRLFQEMCVLLGIDKTRTSPHHPQSDGQVERFNRTLKDMLSAYVAENQLDWDLHLPQVMMAYRASEHSSTGQTPNYLTFGREVELPVDVVLRSPEEPQEITEYAIHLRERMHEAHEKARVHLHKAAKHQKRNYQVAGKPKCLEPGTAVMLTVEQRTVGLSPKLQPRWEGPYLVTEVLNDVNVRIQRGSRHKPKVVHINRLKRFVGEVDKSWWMPKSPALQQLPGSEELEEEGEEEAPRVVLQTDSSGGGKESQEATTEGFSQDSAEDHNMQEHMEIVNGEIGDPPVAEPKKVSDTDGHQEWHNRKRRPPQRYGEWTE